MKKIGLIINPIAGMGGSVGLKGTDCVVSEAILRGAKPMAEVRVRAALEELLPCLADIEICTYPGRMGGRLASEMGFHTVLLNDDKKLKEETDISLDTSAQDTSELAKEILNIGAELLLFAGGDGTARDIYRAVELSIPCVGIPAGVKIHSPVYAKNPRAAGCLARLWLTESIKNTEDREVLDIDEQQYRNEVLSTRLYGYLKVPRERTLNQNRKAPTPLSDTASIETIAYEVIDAMEPDTCYLIGAGTTTRGIMHLLGLKNTLIGVDLVFNRELIANDLYGAGILSYIRGKKTKLVVTITGGQGFLFGRGNQQLTPEVIREIGKENIIILATKQKLADLGSRPLLVDTPDEELNHALCGYYKAITGYGEYTMCKVTDS